MYTIIAIRRVMVTNCNGNYSYKRSSNRIMNHVAVRWSLSDTFFVSSLCYVRNVYTCVTQVSLWHSCYTIILYYIYLEVEMNWSCVFLSLTFAYINYSMDIEKIFMWINMQMYRENNSTVVNICVLTYYLLTFPVHICTGKGNVLLQVVKSSS